MYDVAFVGCGPASIFAVLRLLSSGYDGEILMVDKGELIEHRSPTEYISGWGGAGTFSDGKLTSSLDVGGTIPGLNQKELDEYSNYILETLNQFNPLTELTWDNISLFDTSCCKLSWDVHKTCHMGTEVTREIFKNIEKYIKEFSNVTVISGCEVIDIVSFGKRYYRMTTSTWGFIETKNVVIATGQKNGLPNRIIEQYNLHNSPRAFHLGVRVEDTMNEDYKKITDANYDFKFVQHYTFDNVKIRVRTFCCNSGNAFVVDEQASEGFISFNGHAYKTPDKSNHSINYGIICEVENLSSCYNKNQQIELIKKINTSSEWKADNYNGDKIEAKRMLLDGFANLSDTYPKEVIKALTMFVKELNKIVDLSQAHYYYPEVKLSGYMPKLNFETFETEQPGIYMIGDAAITRGIVKSTYTGDKMAKEFIERWGK